MAEQDNIPSQPLAKATIPFEADLSAFEQAVQRAERMVDDLTDRFKKRLTDALAEPIAEAAEKLRDLEARLTAARRAEPDTTPATESRQGGTAVPDQLLERTTQILAAIGEANTTLATIATNTMPET